MANLSLPHEVWLEIFTNLGYFDLKRCQRVSKVFKALTEYRVLDNAPFRAGRRSIHYGPPEVPSATHPALEEFRVIHDAKGLSGIRLQLSNGRESSLRENTTADELATVPPMRACMVWAGPAGSWDGVLGPSFQENTDGITVRDLMHSCVDVVGNYIYYPDRDEAETRTRVSTVRLGEISDPGDHPRNLDVFFWQSIPDKSNLEIISSETSEGEDGGVPTDEDRAFEQQELADLEA